MQKLLHRDSPVFAARRMFFAAEDLSSISHAKRRVLGYWHLLSGPACSLLVVIFIAQRSTFNEDRVYQELQVQTSSQALLASCFARSLPVHLQPRQPDHYITYNVPLQLAECLYYGMGDRSLARWGEPQRPVAAKRGSPAWRCNCPPA